MILVLAVFAVLLVCSAALSQAAPSLGLNNIFSSNMVLQRAPQQAVMWGTGAPASQVSVSIDGSSVNGSSVGSDGRWLVQLPAQPASFDRTITITDGSSTLTLNNIAFGDVYLCSGQSNMQVTINYTFGGSDAIAAASNYPHLRIFNIPPQYSNTTVHQAAITYADGWVMPNATTLQNANSWQDTWSYFSATCYWSGMKLYDSLRGETQVAIGLLQASYGGTCVAAWTSPDTNTRCGPIVTPAGGDNTVYNQPSVLYNAMIYPLLPLRIRAVLWYQGETDSWDAERYACSFPNMIQDWRSKFNQPWLPFYFVMLAPYSGAPVAIRESSKRALSLPMTGVASAIDLGDHTAPAGDVHPRNKSYVGVRLSLLLQRNLYGQQVEAEGPLLLSVKAFQSTSSRFHITLQYSDDSRSDGMFALPTPGCDSTAKDARACCVQTGPSQYGGLIWYKFTANGRSYTVNSSVRVDPDTRTLTTTHQPPVMPDQSTLVQVSYAAVDWPGCVLYNSARLPALPFQLNVSIELTPSLTFANLYSSNMVLQRNQPNTLWGTGTPGRFVNVSTAGMAIVGQVVQSNGEWRVELSAMKASTDVTITATDGVDTLALTSVAFGDVYLCSGQSNMKITLNYSFGGAEAIAAASKYANIRLYSVPPQWTEAPVAQSNISSSLGEHRLGYTSGWEVPSADTLQNAADSTDVWSYFSAVCWYTGVSVYDSLGSAAVPLGLIHSSVGGTCIAAWNSYETNTLCGQLIEPPPGTFDDFGRNQPSFLYNAMIHPLRYARTGLTAVLWYQGEEDNWQEPNMQSAIDRYTCAFPNLIDDWRVQLGSPVLPFYFVQLAPYTWTDDSIPPLLRAAQLSGLQLPMTGVANTIDLGDMNAPSTVGNIHPRNKSFVGERLARWVRRDVYGQKVAVDGPEVQSVQASLTNDSTVLVVTVRYSTDSRNDGLFALGTPDCVNATRYGCCTPVSDNTVSAGLLELTYPYMDSTRTTSAPVTVDPTARTLTLMLDTMLPAQGAWVDVAYAWQPFPGCALYNHDRLPALSFRKNVTIQSERLIAAVAPPGQFRLNNLFSNNMVLQRAPQQAVMWGYGEPGQTVTVSLDGKQVATGTIGSDGSWSVQLPAQPASTDRVITTTDGSTTLTLKNVAFGDVYLCSGQSNMMIVLNYSFGGVELTAAASRYPNIRLSNIYMQNDTLPRNETGFSYYPDSWVLPSADTLQYTGNWQDVWDYFSAVCYWTGVHLYDSLNGTVPLGLVHSSWGGTCIQAWTSAESNEQCGPLITPPFVDSQNEPSVLYNAMIHPLTPMRLTAVLWYQGESDDFDVDRYGCSFPNMIANWRSKFGYPELPFYFALLAPLSQTDAFVHLRQAQMQALTVSSVGVVNTIDLGDVSGWMGEVHPRNKSYVGERFARWLRRDIYGQQEVAVSGPMVAKVTAELSNQTMVITVAFTAHSSGGLFALPTPNCANKTGGWACCTVSGGTVVDYGLMGYQIEETNHSMSGTVVIDAHNRLMVMTVSQVRLPPAGQTVIVSHAWESFPGCALYNEHGLPALPFSVNVTVENGSPIAAAPAAELMLNNLFSNNMVLQRAPQQAAMWGWGEPGRTVTVTIDGANATATKVDGNGNWTVQLPAQPASTDRVISATDGSTTLTLKYVAFGDVYLCSGQSNMMIVLNYSFGGVEAAARAADYPNIRLFNIFMQYDTVPRNETGVSYSPDSWVLPAADTLQNLDNWQDVFSYFSGVCYWTAMHLYDSMQGTVPLGLVHSSWGGTCVQAWTSPDTNEKCGPLITPGLNTSQNQPSALYNAMLHPLLPMRLAAVMWYQGESDDFDVDRYGCSFPNLINDWRTKFGYGDALPFYFGLLAPYAAEAEAFVGLRQAQMQALLLPMTGVANTIDLGDVHGSGGAVHPRNKSYVGERFARWLRHDIYGEKRVAVVGPAPASMTARLTDSGKQLLITATFTAGTSDGLFALSTPDCVNSTGGWGCCAVSGDSVGAGLLAFQFDDSSEPASGMVTIDQSARTLTLTVSDVKLPPAGQVVTVSHAWEGFPGCALYNEHRLPALPFQVNVTVEGKLGAVALRLNNFFSHNMVLQRAPQQAVMWGYAEPGRNITVQLDNSSAVSSVASVDGDWSVKLPATEASFGRTIMVSDANSSVTLTNVAFGDVYLCSGQSNMQITLNYTFGGSDAINTASQYSNIRLFSYDLRSNDTALNESSAVQYSPDTWVLPSAPTLQASWDPFPWTFFSATCYWTGKHISDSLNGSIPIGLVQSSFGGTVVHAWTSPDTVTKCGPVVQPPGNPWQANNASVLYNAMIHPLLPARFAAVLWYQGESDYYDIERYKCSFPNMIADWRSKFQSPDLPFYFVLLSPYLNFDAQLPLLRLAQLSAIPSHNVGVASAIDLGDLHGAWGDIHPRNKSFVGERLARWVRHDIYKQDVQPLGPEPLNDAKHISLSVSGGTAAKVVLTYPDTDANSGLYMMAAPDCTTCCGTNASVLTVTINITASIVPALTYRPGVTIDQQARTLTATFDLLDTVSGHATAIIGLQAEAWPQCVLYSRHNLPALPFSTVVTINGGSDEEGTSMWYYAIAAVIVLAVVGVVAWLVVRYVRKRQASAEAEDAGYRDVDSRRTGLLSDTD